MKKLFIFVYLITAFSTKLLAQSDEASIKACINQLFTGMKTADSTVAKTAFAADCIMQTIVERDQQSMVQTVAVSSFLKSIGTAHKGVYDERINFTKILIDGPLASVWTDYKFYLDDKLLHCGVNSFQLVKGNKGWQIVYLIDTRRKDGCGE